MPGKTLVICALLLLSAVLLIADVAIEPVVPKTLVNRGGSVCDSYVHISGFSKYPKRDFYIVETIKNGTVLTVSRITGDSVSVDAKKYSLKPRIKAIKYISWDPVLAELKNGQEYRLKKLKINLPDINRQSIDYGRSQRKTIEIPDIEYIGFKRVDNYYGIQWHDPDVHSFYSEYELEWTSQVWLHPQFVIRGSGESAQWYHITSFLDDLTRDYTETYEFWEMQKDDLMKLLAYVPDQPGWELELLVPLDIVKVYYHKGTGSRVQNYSLPIRVPIAYRVLAIVLASLVVLSVFYLFYRVVLRGSGRDF